MEWTRDMISDMEREVVGALIPMFPGLEKEVIKKSVMHPSNRGDQFNNHTLLNRCIDDLLELRTHNGLSDAMVDLTQNLSQNSPGIPDDFSDGGDSNFSGLDLNEEVVEGDDNLEGNDERVINTPSPVFAVQGRESQPSTPPEFQFSDIPSPIDKLSNSSRDSYRPKSNNSTTDQSSNSTPSSQGFDMKTIMPKFENKFENNNSFERDDHLIDTAGPSTNSMDRTSPVPSPNSGRQSSTPSPVDWLHLNSQSPEAKRDLTKSKNDSGQTHATTTTVASNQDTVSNAGHRRPLSTPSPVVWGDPNLNSRTQSSNSVGSNDQRQLTTPSPMSVSSEESSKDDLPFSPFSAISSSNLAEGNLTVNASDVPGSSSNTNKNDDSGFGSSSVSPAIDISKTPVTVSRSSSAFKPAMEPRTYKDSDVIDLTSPEPILAGSISDKILKDDIVSKAPKTTPFSSEGFISPFSNQTAAQSSMPSPIIGLFPLNSTQKPGSTLMSSASSESMEKINSILSKSKFKRSTSSAAPCVCYDCRVNGTGGSHHTNTCSARPASQVKTSAPATVSRPPATVSKPPATLFKPPATLSKPPATLSKPPDSPPDSADLGISLKSLPTQSNGRTPEADVPGSSSASAGVKEIVHTCNRLDGVVEFHQGMDANGGTSTSGNVNVNAHPQAAVNGMPSVGATVNTTGFGSQQDTKLSKILQQNQRTLNNIQQEFNKLVNGESNRKIRDQVMGTVFKEAEEQKEEPKEQKKEETENKATTSQKTPAEREREQKINAEREREQKINELVDFLSRDDPKPMQLGPPPRQFQQQPNLNPGIFGFPPAGNAPFQFGNGPQLHNNHGGQGNGFANPFQPPNVGGGGGFHRDDYTPHRHKHKHKKHRHHHRHNPPPPYHIPPAMGRIPPHPPAHNRPVVPPPAHNRPAVPPPAHNRPPVVQNRPAVPPPAHNRPVVPPPAHNRPAVPPPAVLPPPVQPFLLPPPPLQPLFQPPLIPGAQQPDHGLPGDLLDDIRGAGGVPGDLLDDIGGAGVPDELILTFTSEVLNLFPDAEQDWVRSKVRQFITQPDVVSAVCNHMLENQFPSKNNKSAAPAPEKQPESSKSNTVNFFTEYDNHSLYIGPQAERQAHRLLQNEFRRFSCYTIGAAMALFKHHYAPTRKCLEELINNNEAVKTAYNSSKYSRVDERRVRATVTVKENGKEVERQLRVEVNKSIRGKHFVASAYEPQLQQEIDFFNNKVKCDAEERDRQLALEVNEHQYEAEGQLIECGCCYGDTTFDDMVQCLEGHLFCQTCLQQYAKEATYGEGKAEIVCMTDGCDSIFPRSQLVKALGAKDLSKYDDRVGEESLQLADMGENLVRCPFCNYAALMEEGDKVFQCQDAECKKETCRYCKEEWKDHFGIPCDEIEKKSDTKTRVSYEERMSMAKIRTCHRCKAGFTKSEGCNKMTCRCGAKMCYICRKPNIDYNHFCKHLREPGHSCKQCDVCSLWTNPEQDDERAVQEIRKEMEEEKKAREKRAAAAGEAGDGGPDAKKQRTE